MHKPVQHSAAAAHGRSMSTQIGVVEPPAIVHAKPAGHSAALEQKRVHCPPAAEPRHARVEHASGVPVLQGAPVSSGTQVPSTQRCSCAHSTSLAHAREQNRVVPRSSTHRPLAQSPAPAHRSR
jgi:hypothetical protein